MTVVATRGNLRLIDDGDGQAHIEGQDEQRPIGSFLKWGYWKPVEREVEEEPVTAAGVIPGEEPLREKYERVLERTARLMAKRYRRAMRGLTAADKPNLDQVLDEDELTEAQRKALKAARERLAREAALAAAVDFGISFAVSSPYLQRLVEAHAGKQAERIVEGSRKIAARVIQQSFDEGWGVKETADELYVRMKGAAPWQAKMLARTDLIGLANAGSYAAALSLGEMRPVYKRWINADDEKVRPTHVEAMNQIVPLEHPFTVGDAQLLYPGDPHGPDKEVINCRCTLVYLDDPAHISDHLGSRLTVTSSAWDESEHPRHEGGQPIGGQFAPKGEEIFESSPGNTGELLAGHAQMEKLWEDQTVRTRIDYGSRLTPGMPTGGDDRDAIMAKIRVQDTIAAKLEGDADFKSLIAVLDPYGDWKSSFEPGGDMATATTTEQQVAALAIKNWSISSADSDIVALQFQLAAEQEFGLEPNQYVHDQWSTFVGSEINQEKMRADPDAMRRSQIFNEQQMAGARKFLRAQYDQTQEMFADAGITHVYSYRGMKFDGRGAMIPPPAEIVESLNRATDRYFADDASWRRTGESGRPPREGDYPGLDIVKVHQNPLSSWAHNYYPAYEFSGGGIVKSVLATKIDVRRVLSTPFTGFGCLNEAEMVVLGDQDMDAFAWSWDSHSYTPENSNDYWKEWQSAAKRR